MPAHSPYRLAIRDPEGAAGARLRPAAAESAAGSVDTRTRASSALVLGDHRQSLAVVRSLHRAGYRVITGRTGAPTMLERSRFVAEVWDHPPLSEPRAFTEALEAFCALRGDLRVVFPVGEREIELAAPLRARVPALVAVAAPEILTVCRSKRALLRLAARTGVPTEHWETADEPDALVPSLRRVGLPAVLKPDLQADSLIGFKAAIVQSEEQMRRFATEIAFPQCGFVLQRLARGRRHNVYFVASNGHLLGCSEVRILRTDLPDGTGLAVEGESIPPTPELLAWTKLLATELSYSGAGCVQFMVDEASGTASFLEINARLGANCAAVCAWGLDLPRLFVETLLGVATEQPPSRVGRRYAWLTGDLHGVAHCLRSGRLTWGETVSWLVRAALAQLRAHDHVTWSWRDPLPTLAILGHLLRTVPRRPRHRSQPPKRRLPIVRPDQLNT